MVSKKDKIDLSDGIKLRDNRIDKVPLLTNRDAAKSGTKVPVKKNKVDTNRAIVLNFTRHSEPEDTIDLLNTRYKNIRLFRPIDETGLYIVDNEAHTRINPLVSNPLETSVRTKSQQIYDWLYEYLTTRRDNGLHPLDSSGDYYVILPHKDAQIALEILTALNGIKNADWFIIWSVYDDRKAIFSVAEIVSTKGIYDTWKKVSTQVSDIDNRRKHKLLATISDFETIDEQQGYISSLSQEDFKLIEYAMSQRNTN